MTSTAQQYNNARTGIVWFNGVVPEGLHQASSNHWLDATERKFRVALGPVLRKGFSFDPTIGRVADMNCRILAAISKEGKLISQCRLEAFESEKAHAPEWKSVTPFMATDIVLFRIPKGYQLRAAKPPTEQNPLGDELLAALGAAEQVTSSTEAAEPEWSEEIPF